ncbi:hypothetical protein B0T16DRAFT_449952 [Cercophora newfieldiana]|uniref:Clr5 domain-containing protein n=1 Tax=Cercophora newfieldiana TaxID=92897 RepID=A0AA39XS86_9PEZI|nr:hypothetical protein B0T16DRAFT_449952 [Cercophora newfieldiana]
MANPDTSKSAAAVRIPPERWAKYRAIIGDKYARGNLQELMKEMQEEHDFVATKRQYVHQLDKWGMFKYKSTARAKAPRRSSPQPEVTSVLSPALTPESEEAHTQAGGPPAAYAHFPFSRWLFREDPPLGTTPSATAAPGPQPTHTSSSQASRDGAPSKRQRGEDHVTIEPGTGVGVLTCPYRRRNPRRFNIRDHQACATDVFLDMSQVKLHVRTEHLTCLHHLKCPRCHRVFLTLDDVSAHLAVPSSQICALAPEDMPVDPEDGINFELERVLRESMKETGNIVKMWVDLWRLLFPQDTEVLSPYFEPAVEHFELWDFVMDRFPRAAVVEFLSGAPPAKQLEIEERVRETLKRTMDSFPGPPRQLGGRPIANSGSNANSIPDSNMDSTMTSPPEQSEWDGDEGESAPWLGWFKPPGAQWLPPHMREKRPT